jgi:hypothetical protein
VSPVLKKKWNDLLYPYEKHPRGSFPDLNKMQEVLIWNTEKIPRIKRAF